MYEYILHMRCLGAFGKVDEKSVINYIVDGIDGKPENKFCLYATQSFDELKTLLEAYEKTTEPKKNESTLAGKNAGTNVNNKNRKIKREHCYNCGSVDHKKSECKEQTKCFKCNKTGIFQRAA